MNETLEVIIMFLGFIVFLNFLGRIMFNGIFGARIKESKINNEKNPNSKY